ncbi:MAG TPA: glycosyltransferase family 39 protein [Patescibacteria group bacterium]|nr:glycosyltransferase family 39 protein [Patescibacteria group bacterium]
MIKKHWLLFVVLLAIILRLPLLGGSFWLDEAAQAIESSRSLSQQYRIPDDFQPPLFHYVTHFMLLASGEEWWLRSSSLAFGVGTIAVLYLLVKKTHGESTARIASLLLALSPFHIFFSQELRPYSIACFFGILSWYGLVSKKNWLFIIANVLGMYTMYLFPLVTVSQLLYIFFEQRKRFRISILLSLLSYLSFLPWLPFFFEQLQHGKLLQSTLPGWSTAVAIAQWKALPLTLSKFFIGQVTFTGHPYMYVIAMIAICIFLGGSVFLFKKKGNRIFIYWWVIPLILAWVISFWTPVIAPKRLLYILPAILTIIALIPKKTIIYGFLLLSVVCTAWYYFDPNLQREDWRSLISQIETDAMRSRAVALFSFPESFAPWRWYSDSSVQGIATGKLLISSQSQADETLNTISATTVYVFDYLTDLTDPHHFLVEGMREKGWRELRVLDGKQIGFVHIYTTSTMAQALVQ